MVKFKIGKCLTAFKNLVKSMTCCNSSCCTQRVDMLSDETIQKIQSLQDQLESILQDVNILKQNSPRPSLNEEGEESGGEEGDKDPVFI